LSLFGCWRFATAQLAPHGPYARLLLFKSHPGFQRSLARASRRRPWVARILAAGRPHVEGASRGGSSGPSTPSKGGVDPSRWGVVRGSFRRVGRGKIRSAARGSTVRLEI
jgi:hypothetical protein